MNFEILNDKSVKKIFNLLDDVYIVGGAVRNSLINKQIKDVDFATPLPPEKIINILNKNNIKTKTNGIKFGNIVAIIDGKNFEITTFRKDKYTNSRFPDVKFIKDMKEDSKRRDFTVNALYMDKNGKIYDYHNGLKDIENRVVKFIDNPQTSIQNDPLRILRYFRFCSQYFSDNFDKESLDICIKNFDKISTISKTKIKSEMDKIYKADGANIILDIFKESDILEKLNNYLKD